MQYIKKPRFFTDFISAQRQGGLSDSLDVTGGNGLDATTNKYDLFDSNPCNRIKFDSNGQSDAILIWWRDLHQQESNDMNGSNINSPVKSFQILSHNLNDAGAKVKLKSGTSSSFSTTTDANLVQIYGVATQLTSGGSPIQTWSIGENGSHIFSISNDVDHVYWGIEIEPVGGTYTDDIEIGSIRLGAMYTAPHAVNVSEKHENAKNYKKIKSLGGNVFSYKTHKNPTWINNQAPFQNYTTADTADIGLLKADSYAYSPTNYSMDFSYISDTNYKTASESIKTIQTDSTFNALYSQTLNGHLPVIMQKDEITPSANGSDFSWGYIDTFKRTRIAPNLWNISMGFSEDI